jgi:hypothetical protein
MLLALLIGAAALGAIYNAVRLPADIAARRRFDHDPSCHPSGMQAVSSGACRIEPVRVIGELQRRFGRGGPYFAMDLQTANGATEEVIASAAMAEQVMQPGARVGRLVFGGKAVAYLSGEVVDPASANPTAVVVSRELSILYCALVGIIFSLVSWVRYRLRTQEYDSELHAG